MTGDPFENTAEARLHMFATELVVEGARQSAEKYDTAGDDIVRAAFHVISQDAAITHRATRALVRAGWSGSAAILLRTQFDLLIAATAIVNSQDSHLMAFRYFYSGFRRMERDGKRYDAASRRAARQAIRDRIQKLPDVQRRAALDFLRDKDRAYFFNPEWRTPAEVLGLIKVGDLGHVYAQLSAATHGGFQGMRLFRDDPDDRGINPQLPPGPRALGVLLISSRLVLELVSLRGVVEELEVEEMASALRGDLRRVAGYGKGEGGNAV